MSYQKAFKAYNESILEDISKQRPVNVEKAIVNVVNSTSSKPDIRQYACFTRPINSTTWVYYGMKYSLPNLEMAKGILAANTDFLYFLLPEKIGEAEASIAHEDEDDDG